VNEPSVQILLFQDFFRPGFLAGGMQTATALLLAMPGNLEFRVYTSDRDLGQRAPYPGISSDSWTQVWFGKREISVWYCKQGRWRWGGNKELIYPRPAWIYLQGVFGWYFFLLPLGWAIWTGVRVLICPHGMLDDGCLRQKPLRKFLYLLLFRLVPIHRKIRWQATSAHEQHQIRQIFGAQADIALVPLPVPALPLIRLSLNAGKLAKTLRLLYFGRISPKKNVHLLLQSLMDLPEKCTLTIAGPIEDNTYWRKRCLPLLGELGKRVRCLGAVPSLSDIQELNLHHFMVLPSVGENFSYALFESLAIGLPVLISMHTPWGPMITSKQGGMVIKDLADLSGAFKPLYQMSGVAYDRFREGARQCALAYTSQLKSAEAYAALFSL